MAGILKNIQKLKDFSSLKISETWLCQTVVNKWSQMVATRPTHIVLTFELIKTMLYLTLQTSSILLQPLTRQSRENESKLRSFLHVRKMCQLSETPAVWVLKIVPATGRGYGLDSHQLQYCYTANLAWSPAQLQTLSLASELLTAVETRGAPAIRVWEQIFVRAVLERIFCNKNLQTVGA